MALVIEDGTLVAGANSFVARAEIVAYAAARGVTLADDETTDILAVQAIDYIWSQCLKGELVESTQTVPFPRTGLIDGDDAEGYAFTIPAGVKKAQLQLALTASNGPLAAPALPGMRLKRRKVGPMEREFFAPGESGASLQVIDPIADALLKPFLCEFPLLRTVRA